jgi:hypothetical protein
MIVGLVGEFIIYESVGCKKVEDCLYLSSYFSARHDVERLFFEAGEIPERGVYVSGG